MRPFFAFLFLALLTADGFGGVLYFSTGMQGSLRRHDLASGMMDSIITDGVVETRSIALDVDAGYIYWADAGAGTINRSNWDGSGVETLITGLERPVALKIDPTNEVMYWLDSKSRRIEKAAVGGGEITMVSTNVTGSSPLLFDGASNSLLWTSFDEGSGLVHQQSLDTGEASVLFSISNKIPLALAMDEESRMLYWSEIGIDGGNGRIRSYDLATSETQTVTEHPAVSMAIDGFDDFLYWSDFADSRLVRSNLATSTNGDVLVLPGILPLGLALDLSIIGDADFNRVVNMADYELFRDNFLVGARRSQGDFNSDHAVNLLDFVVLKKALSVTEPMQFVPESATFHLAITASFLVLWTRRSFSFRKPRERAVRSLNR